MEIVLKVDVIGNSNRDEDRIMNEPEYKKWRIISINKRALIQYVLIYILIQYIGGRVLAALGSDFFYGGTLAFCALLMLAMPDCLPLKKSVFGYLIILGCSLGISFIITGGALSVGSILSVLSRFILVYVAIQFDTEHFICRFIKIVFFMACLSLIEFIFVQIVGDANALGLFSHLYQIRNGISWLGSSYGLFFFCYNFMDSTRNAYMFGEPGEYQILLIVALYFMTFCHIDFDNKERIRYYVVFLITLLTTQSTTGYLNLLALTVAVLAKHRNQINPVIRKITIIFVLVFIFYMLFIYSENSFLYNNFFSKILSDSNSLDLATDTGAARIGPMRRFMETISVSPQKLIFGVGFSGLRSLPLGGYSTCGLINSVAMMGIVSSILLYGKLLSSLFHGSEGLIQFFLAVFIVINMGLSQPDILCIASVLICMYCEYSGLRYIKE